MLFFRVGQSNSAAPTKEHEDGPRYGYSSAAALAVMQAANHWLGHDPAMIRSLHRAIPDRTLHSEKKEERIKLFPEKMAQHLHLKGCR
jgi:hypothetical protein